MKIDSQSERTFRVEWTVPADLPYLAGHFPQMPIVPAVGILDGTAYALQLYQKRPVRLQGIASAKFLHPVVPHDRVTLDFEQISAQAWRCDWRLDEKRLSSLRIETE